MLVALDIKNDNSQNNKETISEITKMELFYGALNKLWKILY